MGANIDENLANAWDGVYIFRIQGALYYRIGGLMPKNDNQQPSFAQIYFYDTNLEVYIGHRTELWAKSSLIINIINKLYMNFL